MYILRLTLSLHCHKLIVFLRKSLIHGRVHVFNLNQYKSLCTCITLDQDDTYVQKAKIRWYINELHAVAY